MKVSIRDDWFDTLRHLKRFEKLHGHEVVIWIDHGGRSGELEIQFSDIFDQIVAYAQGASINVVDPDALGRRS
ncbi:MAG: hypothetical protein QM651_06830 [Rhodoblastus sp.]